MNLDQLREGMLRLKPQVNDQLNYIIKERRRVFGKAMAEKDMNAQNEVDLLKEKERYLVGIVGAMNRLDDQIINLRRTEAKKLLTVGAMNE